MCDTEFKDQLSLETRADAWGVWEGTTDLPDTLHGKQEELHSL